MRRSSILRFGPSFGPYTLLALAMSLLLFVYAPLQQMLDWDSPLAGRILFGLVLAAGAYASLGNRTQLTLVFVLGLPPFALVWVEALVPAVSNVPGLALATVFLIYTTGTILRAIMTTANVTSDTIAGGIAIYLLVAVIFALLYSIVGSYDPDAFAFPEGIALPRDPHAASKEGSVLLYFSLVTISSLGYGDVVPNSPIARSLAGAEATFGQVYLTVLVARLVGLHVSRRGS